MRQLINKASQWKMRRSNRETKEELQVSGRGISKYFEVKTLFCFFCVPQCENKVKNASSQGVLYGKSQFSQCAMQIR